MKLRIWRAWLLSIGWLHAGHRPFERGEGLWAGPH